MNLVQYRPADNPEYIDQVVDALLAESPELQGVEVERDVVKAMLEKSPAIQCLIHLDQDALLAVAVMSVGPIWYAPKRRGARDLLIWVAPKWRGGVIAVRLIRAIEDWARRESIDHLFLSQSTGIKVERTADFYARLGYTVSGFISHKRIDHVHRI